MLQFLLSENADKNYILAQSSVGLGAKAHMIRLKYTKLATYKFVKSICVLWKISKTTEPESLCKESVLTT